MKTAVEIETRYEANMDAREDDDNQTLRAKDDILGWATGNTDAPFGDGDAPAPKTDADIQKAIDILKTARETLPEYSFFGDANWRNIEAQIKELEWILS